MVNAQGLPVTWMVQFLNDVQRLLFGSSSLVTRVEELEAKVIDLQNQIDTHHP